jgi:hypothetical protein
MQTVAFMTSISSGCDGLVPHVLIETDCAELATDATGFVAAKRTVKARWRTIRGEEAGPDLARDLNATLGIGSPYAAAKAIRRIVGDSDGICLVLVRNNNEDRTEDLFSGDPHRVADVGEQSGAQVEASFQAFGNFRTPCDQPRSFSDTYLDVVTDSLSLVGSNHGSNKCGGIGRIPDYETLHQLLELANNLFLATLGGEDPGMCNTALAVVAEREELESLDHRIKIGILENDGGRFAA